MPFVLTLGFATEHDRAAFEERIVPKLRAQQTEPASAPEPEADGLHRIGLAVTSQSAARDICRQVVAFLAHAKGTRVTVEWRGADDAPQRDQIEAGEQRQAERVELLVGAAARARLEAEKAPSEPA